MNLTQSQYIYEKKQMLPQFSHKTISCHAFKMNYILRANLDESGSVLRDIHVFVHR